MTASVVDAETGAYVRRYFEGLVHQAVVDSRDSTAPLCLLWVDLDELTEANDLHGREAVDAALALFAQTLARVLEGRFPIGRVAGGAFAALMPGVDLAAATAWAEKVRAAGQPGTGFTLRVSCGVAAFTGAEPYGNLLDAAEAACTRAKQGGRDQVARR